MDKISEQAIVDNLERWAQGANKTISFADWAKMQDIILGD
jgi:hypothetical protein